MKTVNKVILIGFFSCTTFLNANLIKDGICKPLGKYNTKNLKFFYSKFTNQDKKSIVVIDDKIYSCSCFSRKFGGDTESRNHGGDLENRIHGANNQKRNISGNTEGRTFGGNTEDRNHGGNTEKRNISANNEQRLIGGSSEGRNLGGNTQNRIHGSNTEKRNFGGDSEVRNLGGNSEFRLHSGGVSSLTCTYTEKCIGYEINTSSKNVKYFDGSNLFKSLNKCIK